MLRNSAVSTIPQSGIAGDLRELAWRLARLGPLAAAFFYPLMLAAFHAAIRLDTSLGNVGAAFLLTAAIGVPIYALLAVARLGRIPNPTHFERRGLRLNLLAIGAPPLFVFAGVATSLLHLPVGDLTLWSMAWLLALLIGLTASDQPAPVIAKPVARTRVLHGVIAACLVLFFGFHLTNHLIGWLGPDAHGRVMALGRLIYRSRFIEPALVALLLGQVALGVRLARRWSAQPIDRYRALQIGSGAYIGLFALTHLNSAFVSARWVNGIATDWAWASGAPDGLISNAWNIRLLPHYALGVFFLLAHNVCGIRVILLEHGISRRTAKLVGRGGIAMAALIAILIIAALCGARL